MSDFSKSIAGAVNADLFEHEMIATSKTLGRNHDLTVTIGGDKASAKDGQIVLPALNRNSSLTPEAANTARGFVDHEAGKQRFTNKRTMARFAKHEKHNLYLKNLESVRQEARFQQEYEGSTIHMDALSRQMVSRYVEQLKAGKKKIAKPSDLVPILSNFLGRQKNGARLDVDDMKYLTDMAGPDNTAAADKLADIAINAKSTLAIGDMLEKWLGKIDPPTDAEREEDSEKGGDGEEGEGDGDPIGDGYDAGGNADGGDDLMREVVNAVLPTGGVDSYRAYTQMDTVWDDFNEYVSKRIRKNGAVWDGKRTTRTLNDVKYGSYNGGINPKTMRPQGQLIYKSVRESLGPVIRKMKATLERALITAKETSWEEGHIRGALDPKRMAQVAVGDRNIRRVKSDDFDIDCAVSLVVDMSGSMQGDRAFPAMVATMIFADALAKIDIPFEVIGFSSDAGQIPSAAQEWSARNGYIDMPVFKQFHESLKSCEWKIGLIDRATSARLGGNNADGDSIAMAWDRLRVRENKRKVMIVFSDGQPHTSGRGDEHTRLRHVINRIEAAGALVYGVGIESDSVEYFYPANIVVNNVNDLPKKGAEILKNLIVPDHEVRKRGRKGLRDAA